MPSSFTRPVDQSRLRSGTLETYTCAFGAPARNCRIDASNDARKSATGVISRTESRHASFAPVITVTSSGRSFAASAICSGNCTIRDPDTAWFQLRSAAFDGPSSRTARLRTASSDPVAHDTSGQSASTEHASKPRVIESPTAATDPGRGFQSGVGEGDGEAPRVAAGAFRDTPPSAPSELHPASAATPTHESAVSAAAVVRIRGRVARSGIGRIPSGQPLAYASGHAPGKHTIPRSGLCAPCRVKAGESGARDRRYVTRTAPAHGSFSPSDQWRPARPRTHGRLRYITSRHILSLFRRLTPDAVY